MFTLEGRYITLDGRKLAFMRYGIDPDTSIRTISPIELDALLAEVVRLLNSSAFDPEYIQKYLAR